MDYFGIKLVNKLLVRLFFKFKDMLNMESDEISNCFHTYNIDLPSLPQTSSSSKLTPVRDLVMLLMMIYK